MKSFDYIVIGAGSAGAAAAGRLSEDPDIRVLLLEAGQRDAHPGIHMPIAWSNLWRATSLHWQYMSEPEPALGGRRLNLPRGKTLGGSSSVNGLVYVRGHPRDYDLWRQRGLAGWGFSDVLPYFKRLETHWRGADDWHGGDGPVHVTQTREPSMHHQPLEDAAVAAGHAASPDLFGAEPEGVSRLELTTGGGARSSTAVAYIRPALARPNFEVETGALTTRVLVEHGRAVGVEYRQDGQVHRAYAEREVVLSGGAYNSPQLLMLSGIGPADELRALGIEPIHDLPGVGRNLSEHPLVQIAWRARGEDTFIQHLRYDRAILHALRWAVAKSGPFAGNGAGTNIFLRTNPSLERPDIQLICSAIGVNAQLWFPGLTAPGVHRFSCGVCLLHPESRGWVKLRSADPSDPPRILFNMLERRADLDALLAGVRAAQDIYSHEPQKSLLASELWPGDKVKTAADLETWVRKRALPTQHPVGTCAMGPGEEGVVDAELRVQGIQGLRVADASVMPDEPGGNTNIPTIMIGEKAADLLRGRTLPPEDPR